MKKVIIYTDGACRGNPGPGGWGVLIRYNNHEKKLYGGDPLTTNNKMELTAAIKALQALKEPCLIDLTTDSKYLQQGITIWINKWRQNNWKSSNKKVIKNLELWQQLEHEIKHHTINWHWTKSHNGNIDNELVDQLANKGIDKL
jgi:ribonuclease HI